MDRLFAKPWYFPLFYQAVPLGLWDLSFLTRDQTCAPCSGTPNHWMTREVPHDILHKRLEHMWILGSLGGRCPGINTPWIPRDNCINFIPLLTLRCVQCHYKLKDLPCYKSFFADYGNFNISSGFPRACLWTSGKEKAS